MTIELVVRDAHVYVKRGRELPGGWVAIKDGRIHSVGDAGEEPESLRTISAGGRLLTPGLINAHHHMYQNLTLVPLADFTGEVTHLAVMIYDATDEAMLITGQRQG